MNHTRDELLICMLARRLRDHEVIAVGNNSPVPAAAALLAKAMHASHAVTYIVGQPDWPFEGMKEFFDWMQRGGVDVFFLSGAQIDSYGNINLHVIGDYSSPKVRLPGGAGSAVVYFMCKRIFLFKTDHTAKGFPEKLDFVTSASASGSRVKRNGRLEGVFTPLGILEPTGKNGCLRLSATAPGVTPLEVQSHTGFDIGAKEDPPDAIAIIDPPSDEELALLRTVVCRELMWIYPEFAKQLLHSSISAKSS